MFSTTKFKRSLKDAGFSMYGGLTPFAEEAGIHLSTLSYIINGKRKPSLKVLLKLVKTINKHLSDDQQIGITDLINK